MSNKPNTVVTLTFGTVKANRVLDAFAALLNDHDNKVYMMKDTNYTIYKNLYEEVNTALVKAQKGSGYSKRGVKREFIDPERRDHLLRKEQQEQNH